MFRGKKYVESAKLIDRSVQYDPNEALDLVGLQTMFLHHQEPLRSRIGGATSSLQPI